MWKKLYKTFHCDFEQKGNEQGTYIICAPNLYNLSAKPFHFGKGKVTHKCVGSEVINQASPIMTGHGHRGRQER